MRRSEMPISSPVNTFPARSRPGAFRRLGPFAARLDWRAWIALAWALWWARAYCLMVTQARSPQIWAWIESNWK
jgi:hypothetical protein